MTEGAVPPDATPRGRSVGPGLLLTSGLQPGVLNTLPSFGQANIGAGGSANGDPLIDAVVNTVFTVSPRSSLTYAR